MADKNGVGGSMQSVTGSKNALYTDEIKFKQGTWWQRRSSLEKKLVFLVVVCFIVALIFFIVLIVLATRRDSDDKPKVELTTQKPSQEEICTTAGCVTAAARIMDFADLTVDPCEDFFEYACGSYVRKTEIAEDRPSADLFYLLDDRLRIKLRDVIEAPKKVGESASIEHTRNLYQSCLDTDTLEERGTQPLLDFLPRLGGWPLLDPTWNESTFNLERALATLSRLNQVPIIYMAVRNDLANSSTHKLFFDQPAVGMPSRDYYLKGRNDSKLLAYEKLANEMVAGLGADPDVAKEQIAEMIDFEIQIANITRTRVERLDNKKTYNLYTMKEMSQNYSSFDWLTYVKLQIDENDVNINVTEDEVVVNSSPLYFEKLFPLLQNTPKRVLANYVNWIMSKQLMKLLDVKFRDMVTRYNEVMFGVTAEPPRWKVCLSYVNKVMGLSLARLFTDKYFDENAKSTILELIVNLKEAFSELLMDVDWMDDQTRELAREKADVMKQKIGYPDAIKNNTYLDEYYRDYIFNVSTYLENVVTVFQTSSKRNLGLLRQSVDKSKWLLAPAVVNAYYYSSWNEIVFPAGILQDPLYSENQPWSLNFGGIGSVIGHEITHGFDNRGRQTDKDGNLRDWWDEAVVEKFTNETQCFIDQTSRFFMPDAGQYINGQLTVGEDIADNGGLKQSFRAYRKFISKRGREEPRLPGLTLDNNQLFFLSWGQFWCSKIRPDAAKNQILNDYHSPHRYRAVGPMLNSHDFAKAFGCKKNSPMNPSDKCSLW